MVSDILPRPGRYVNVRDQGANYHRAHHSISVDRSEHLLTYQMLNKLGLKAPTSIQLSRIRTLL